MLLDKNLLPIVLLGIAMASTQKKKENSGKHKSENIDSKLWKKLYEDELTDAMLNTRRRENVTRVAQSVKTDSEMVMEKLLDSISLSEQYMKKVSNIDFRLNRLDIEIHEKTNNIIKHTMEVKELISNFESGMANVKSLMNALKVSVQDIKNAINRNNDVGIHNVEEDEMPDVLDTRLTTLETNVKTIMNGVATVVSIISEVKNRNYATKVPPAKDHAETMLIFNEIRRGLSEKLRKCDCKDGRVDRTERFPTDCYEILIQGFNVSGIYKIKPDDMDPFYVLCDLTTVGGGWTVFQNRFDGSQDFYKSWADYRNGFGNLAGEFWLGLDKLNCLTNQKLYELRIEMETQHGLEAYAAYSVFTVGPEHEGFRISTLGSFHGTAGDSLSYHAGQKFSTVDLDNDEWKEGACAEEHGGAWWYKECDKSNLNGKYSKSSDDRGKSIYWISFKGPSTLLSKTRMMIRPLPASRPVDYIDNSRGMYRKPTRVRN